MDDYSFFLIVFLNVFFVIIGVVSEGEFRLLGVGADGQFYWRFGFDGMVTLDAMSLCGVFFGSRESLQTGLSHDGDLLGFEKGSGS